MLVWMAAEGPLTPSIGYVWSWKTFRDHPKSDLMHKLIRIHNIFIHTAGMGSCILTNFQLNLTKRSPFQWTELLSKGPFTRCGSGNVGVGLFHCIAVESVHMRVLHAAVATAVIAANFVCFALFTILENSTWICFDIQCCKIQEL